MNRPNGTSTALASLGGLANAVIVVGLLRYFEYPLVETTIGFASVVVTAFVFGFLPVLISVRTGLLTPTIGFLTLLIGVVLVEITTPAPERVGRLGSSHIVEGPFYVYEYADSWYVWLALLLVAGVGEFAIRRGYGLGDQRLRRVPTLPLSQAASVGVAVGLGSVLGAATALLTGVSLGLGPIESVIIGCLVAAATAIPLTALLSSGIVAPFALFAFWIVLVLRALVFGSPTGIAALAVPGLLAVLCTVVWIVEHLLRSRFRGWNGGRFANSIRPR
ncbi:hypothetical protein [Natrinema marinum]|uniref:hypothetical protein n=1 Tax=Natrinema marinum TaxID=2961598 RepID=UPI0020C879B3|nr:hypothetical protein [Natrinema marinum]